MTPIWTDEQYEAISHPALADRAAVVSAAAGSGKTAVLVERVIRLLTEGDGFGGDSRVKPIVRADKIVLVTFTRKAAAEMKERLEKALRAVAASSDSADAARIAERQLIRLEEAKITTINAFCLGLLKDNPAFAGLESGFAIADESELELLKKKAMAAVLEWFYDLPPEDVEPVCAFFGAGSDAALRLAVSDLYEFTRHMPNPEEWVGEQVRLYENPDEYFNRTVPPYYAGIKADIVRAIELTEESLALAACDGTRKFLKGDLDFFNGCYADYGYKGEFPRMNVRGEDEEVRDGIKNNRAETMKIKEKTIAAQALIAHFKESVVSLRPVVKILAQLFRLYGEKFAEVKRRRKVIDFSDAEHLVLKLLKGGNASAVERIRADCELLIVDEFQDSNFLQYEIFRLLDGGGRKSKLFLVGDIKQSIYRFRGADSAVFAEVSRNPDYKVMYLSNNFRSSDQVIKAVNGIFGGVMPDYDDSAKLRSGRKLSDGSYAAELRLLNAEDFPDTDGATAEAEYAAVRIKDMVRSGFKVSVKRNGKEVERDCDWGDFAVLSSTGESTFSVYEKVFAAHGIPCVSAGGYGYLKAEETGLALDLLTAIDNPYNDLSLFNVMMSPLFGFTAEEIAVIRLGNREIPLYSAVLRYSKTDGKSNERVSSFLKTMARYRRIADTGSARELIAAVNGEGGFLPLITDVRTKANIRLLTYYAEVFADTKADSGLPAFLTYIKELKEVGRDIKQANVDSRTAGSVRLTTIHAAKGLEFPVCFIARTNKEYNFRGGRETVRVKCDKTAGITMECFDRENLCRVRTLHFEYAARLNREFTAEEELRKLYVATTRAECKLIFTGFVKDGKITENSYLQQITASGNIIGEVVTKADLADLEKKHENHEKSEREANPEVKDEKHLKDEIKKIRENIALEYPREILGAVPRKLTATQVSAEQSAAEEYDEPSVFPRNPSFHGQKRLTGKKRGDAYHAVMELIDFGKGDYETQFKSIADRFTPVEYKAVDPRDIIGFFKSELGRRAVKSGKVVKEYKLYTEIELSELGIAGDFPDKPFVQGIADMFFYEDGEIVLVDYKTNRNTTREKLVRAYEGQLRVYKKAIEEMTGVRVKECVIYSFELGEVDVN